MIKKKIELLSLQEFAELHHLPLRRTIGLIGHDITIRAKRKSGNKGFYDKDELEFWLGNNKGRYAGDGKPDTPATNDFYCTGCGIYTPNERKSATYNCCTGCEKKANQARIDSRKNEKEEKKTITHAMKIKNKLDDFAAKRALDDLTTDSWMYNE